MVIVCKGPLKILKLVLGYTMFLMTIMQYKHCNLLPDQSKNINKIKE